MEPKPSTIPPSAIPNISTLKRGGDVIKLLAKKDRSSASRLSIRKAATTLDKMAMEITMKDREIKRLRAQLAQVKPPKRRKVVQDLNERFASLGQILAQANQEPQQRVRKAQEVSVVKEESSSESEEEPAPTRRSVRDRRPTKRYLERDSSADDECD